MPTDEDDNTLSFRLEGADPETGATYGTLVNTPGDNGLYANYMYGNSIDVNDKYRIFPAGKSRWGKLGVDSKVLYIFDYADEGYTTPLYGVELLEAGNHEYALRCHRLQLAGYPLVHGQRPEHLLAGEEGRRHAHSRPRRLSCGLNDADRNAYAFRPVRLRGCADFVV